MLLQECLLLTEDSPLRVLAEYKRLLYQTALGLDRAHLLVPADLFVQFFSSLFFLSKKVFTPRSVFLLTALNQTVATLGLREQG